MAECHCGEPAISRGLCRFHYDEERRAGRLNGDRKVGRKKGAVPVSVVAEDGYTPTMDELVTRAKQVTWEILNNPNASQAERNNVLRLLLSGKDRVGGLSPDQREDLKSLFGAATGE